MKAPLIQLKHLNNFFKPALLLTVFLTPLIFAGFDLGFEQIKVIFFILSLSLTGFIWLLIPENRIKPTGIKIAGAIFILILIITGLSGINPLNSLIGTPVYYQGLILFCYLYFFSILVSQTNISLKSWAVILSLSSSVVGLLAIKDALLIGLFNSPVLTYSGRVVSTFGQPNFYAGFILINLPFIFYLSLKNFPKLKLYQVLFLITNITGIIISLSRGAYLILCFIVFIFLLQKLKKFFKKVIYITIAIIILSSISLSIIFSTGLVWFELGGQRINQHALDAEANRRIYIWQAALSIIAQRPLTGFGLENIQDAYSNYFNKNFGLIYEQNRKILIAQNLTPGPVLQNIKNLTLSRTHNYPMDLLLFSGILGFSSWLFLVALLLKKARSNILLSSLLIYLIWIQFQNQSIVNLMQFFLLVGLIDKDQKSGS